MIKKIIGYVAAMMMTAAACTGFTVAGQGYEMYQAAVAETSLESMVDSIRSKEGSGGAAGYLSEWSGFCGGSQILQSFRSGSDCYLPCSGQ